VSLADLGAEFVEASGGPKAESKPVARREGRDPFGQEGPGRLVDLCVNPLAVGVLLKTSVHLVGRHDLLDLVIGAVGGAVDVLEVRDVDGRAAGNLESDDEGFDLVV